MQAWEVQNARPARSTAEREFSMPIPERPLLLAQRMGEHLQALAQETQGRMRAVALVGTLASSKDSYDRSSLEAPWSIIHNDPDQEYPLFLRIPLRFEGSHGFADVALRDWLGQPILGLSEGPSWQPGLLLQVVRGQGLTPVRWFSHNLRDVALFCTLGRRRVYVDALRSSQRRLVVVPEASFVPWSVQMNPRRKAFNRRLYKIFRSSTVRDWKEALATGATKSVHCSDKGPPCVRGIDQQNPGWCLPSALQSLLEYHRVLVDKACIAAALGLHPDDPGVSERQEQFAVKLVESMSSYRLNSRLMCGANWSYGLAKAELDDSSAARPFVTLGGHARTVGGYGFFELQAAPVEGLMSADPWGPKIWWETFDASGGRAITARA
jgi:hypothetical protein